MAAIFRFVVRSSRLALAGCVVTLLAAQSAQALTILPSAQGTVVDDEPDGVGDFVSAPGHLLPGLTDNGSQPGDNREQRGIVEFDLSSISGFVVSAMLEMSLHGGLVGDEGSFTVDLLTYEGDGTVGTDDYGAGTFFKAETYDVAECCDPATDHFIDVTTLIRDLVDASAGFAGFNVQRPSLRRTDDRGTIIAQFGGSSIGSHSPTLFVEVGEAPTSVAEPGTLLLLASALGLAGATRRRNRR